jgi:hypothetical protein
VTVQSSIAELERELAAARADAETEKGLRACYAAENLRLARRADRLSEELRAAQERIARLDEIARRSMHAVAGAVLSEKRSEP